MTDTQEATMQNPFIPQPDPQTEGTEATSRVRVPSGCALATLTDSNQAHKSTSSARHLLRYQAKVGRHVGRRKNRKLGRRLMRVSLWGMVFASVLSMACLLWFPSPVAARYLYFAYFGLAGLWMVALVLSGVEGDS